MDGRKLRDYYLSFYAPKFLIPISRSRLSVVMSHFLISARSDYYAIEPLYKTLISRYMSCGGELATLAALFLAPLARHGPQDQPGAARTSLGAPILRWTIVYGFIVRVVPSLISVRCCSRSIIPHYCFKHLHKYVIWRSPINNQTNRYVYY